MYKKNKILELETYNLFCGNTSTWVAAREKSKKGMMSVLNTVSNLFTC